MNVKVKYFDPKMPRLVKTEKGDWVDLSVRGVYVCNNSSYEIPNAIKKGLVDPWNMDDSCIVPKGQVVIVRLGVAMHLPPNKKAQIIARSSTFSNYGLVLTNCVGAIDNKYQGDNDEWLAVFYASRCCKILKYARICQFDIVDRMEVEFEEVDKLGLVDRGGYGTTGK